MPAAEPYTVAYTLHLLAQTCFARPRGCVMSGARYGCMADASMPALAEQIVMLPLHAVWRYTT